MSDIMSPNNGIYRTNESGSPEKALDLGSKQVSVAHVQPSVDVHQEISLRPVMKKLCSFNSADQESTPAFNQNAIQNRSDKFISRNNCNLRSQTEKVPQKKPKKTPKKSMDLLMPGWQHEIDSAKLSSEKDCSLLFVNDIKSTARKYKSPHKSCRGSDSKRHKYVKSKNRLSHTKSDFSSKCSVFSKEALDPRFQEITKLIYESP